MVQIKALDMVRRIRDTQYEQTRDMSREELKEYFRKEAARMDSQAQRLLREQAKTKEVA
jgi:hypothetical protein